eukprot:7900333-Pyramimonas_sp.AAC.1
MESVPGSDGSRIRPTDWGVTRQQRYASASTLTGNHHTHHTDASSIFSAPNNDLRSRIPPCL